MNPEDKKHLYSPLTEMMEDEMQCTSRPPAYQPLQQSQQNNQLNNSPKNPVQQYQPSIPIPNVNVTNIPPTANSLGEVMIINNPQVGPKPLVITCPHCRARSKTTIRYSSTSKTHIACLLLSWTMCCCCLPYCMHSCQNANHYCSMCDTFIGTYSS